MARGRILSGGSRQGKRAKPEKPRPDFPLTAHPNGQWCKKVRGTVHFFGVWADPDAALNLWLDQRDDLLAGRKPRDNRDGLSVRDLCNAFMTLKDSLRQSGEITERTFRDYFTTCDRICKLFGKSRLVEDLDSADFLAARNEMSKTFNVRTLGNEINRMRGVFKFAYDEGLIDRPLRYGQSFNRPRREVIRKHRQAQKQEHGLRMFQAADLRNLIDAAPQPLKTFILLAANSGMGQSDIANMPASCIDLTRGWIDYPRPKTGIERRFPLWPETITALREALAVDRHPKDPADAGLAFLTKYGQRYVRLTTGKKQTWTDAIGREFTKLLKSLDPIQHGRNFYAIRHTFETIAGATADQVAVDFVMGHADASMAETYREMIDDDRLQGVVDHVRGWLFAEDRI
jgi:integrase